MLGIMNDLRYAIRSLRGAPVFTALAVLSLALGIGANTAIFSLLDGLMFRSLRVTEPDRLVTLEQVLPDGSRLYNFSVQDAERFERLPQVFAGVSATTWADGYNIAVGTQVDERLARVSIVTGSFFRTIGVRPAAGRTFDSNDDRAEGATPVAVISDAYWQRRFNRAADVIGRTLELNRTIYEIVGVTPRGFSGDWVGWPTDLWIPVAMAPQVFGESAPGLPRGLRRQFKVVARLAPGVSHVDARAAADTVYRQLQVDSPSGSGVTRTGRLELVSAVAGYSPQRTTFAQPLAGLMAAVGAVLLIACANVANLLLARTSVRRREMAIRTAIGASRFHIVRLVMVEGFLIALMAGTLGLLAAAWETSALASLARSGPVGSVNFGAQLVDLDVRLDGRLVAFTMGLCLLTPLLFALAPALRASVWSAGRGAWGGVVESEGSDGRFGARRLLVVGQVAVSLMLIVGTGLLLRSLINLKTQELGFARQRLLLAWTLPSATGRQGPALLAFWTDVQQRIASLPGVLSASPSAEGLLSGGPTGGPLVRVEGAPVADALRAEATMTVGTRFFETIEQPLVVGREFLPADTDASTAVVIVNYSFARRLFGEASPVGRRLLLGPAEGSPAEIAGVVADAVHNAPRAAAQRTLYYPAAQNLRRLRSMTLAIRTSGDPLRVAADVRQELRAIDPQLPIMRIDTLNEQLDAVLFQDRLITNLALTFGVLAVALSGAGLCAMLFYAIARRTKEIGVRVALGASHRAVLQMIVRETFVLVLFGLATGIPLTLTTTRLMSARLFGVAPNDPVTILAAALTISAVSLAAAAAPARRAARVDPMIALRCD